MSANPHLLRQASGHKPTHHRRLAEELKKPLRLRHNSREQNPSTLSIQAKGLNIPNTGNLGIPIRGITNNRGIRIKGIPTAILSTVAHNSHNSLAHSPCPKQTAWTDRL